MSKQIIFLIVILTFSWSKNAMSSSCSVFGINDKYETFKDEYRWALDKFKHCSFSCQLQRDCGALKSTLVGLVKESMDIFGDGQAEWGDLDSNLQGIVFGKYNKNTHCDKICGLYYRPSKDKKYNSLDWYFEGKLSEPIVF